MTEPAEPGPAGFDPEVTATMADLGIDLSRFPLGTSIDRFVAEMGEPAFAWLVFALESHLPQPFPEDLLQQIDTLDDLAWFAETKRSHNP